MVNVNLQRRRSSRSTGNSLYVSHNKYGSLLLGLISGLTSVSNVDRINKCLPSQWRVKKVTASRRHSSNPEGKNIEMFLNMLSKVIKIVCRYKKQIKRLFIKKLHLRNRKLFLQMSDSRWKWRAFKNVVRNFKKNINNVQKISKKVGKGKKGWKRISRALRNTVKKIKGLFLMYKHQLQRILPFDFVKHVITKVIPCLKKRLSSTGKQIVRVMRGISHKITTITSRGFAGFAQVFVDLVCQFDKFRAAAHELVRGINEKHENRKFFYFGNFAGQVLSTIGKARFMRMGLFLMKY
jgi:hypothetical protein